MNIKVNQVLFDIFFDFMLLFTLLDSGCKKEAVNLDYQKFVDIFEVVEIADLKAYLDFVYQMVVQSDNKCRLFDSVKKKKGQKFAYKPWVTDLGN